MIRFITRKLGFLFVFAFVSAMFLATCGSSDAQIKANKDLPKIKQPPTLAPLPNPPTPGAFSGYVNGKVAIVQYDNMLPAPGTKGGTFKNVGSLDLKASLAEVWNLKRTTIQDEIAKMLKAPIDGRKLYSPTITVANAGAANRMFMAITPSSKTVALHYYVPGQKIVCKAEVDWWFDPTVTITFDLDLTMVLKTNGGAAKPMVLQSATLYAYNAKVLVDGDRNTSAEKTINAKKMEVKDKLQPAIDLLNAVKLAPLTANGFGTMTPMHTLPGVNANGADLILQLTRSAPVATQAKVK